MCAQAVFGATFGTTVHRAIGLVLRDPDLTPTAAVGLAAQSTGLGEHLAEAVEDVDRALTSLRAEGLSRSLGSDLQIEYPVAGAPSGGLLLSGYVDGYTIDQAVADALAVK